MINRILKETGAGLFIIIAVIFFIALISLYSASHRPGEEMAKNFALQQTVWIAAGFCILIFTVLFGYERSLDYAYAIFAVNILLLILVLAVGSIRFGAKRWLSLGLFSLQPSEICKVSYILALVKYVADNSDRVNSIRVFVTSLLICVVPLILIIKQPDLGTAVVFLPVLLVVLFVAGLRKRYVFWFFLTSIISSPFLWSILKGYQKKRLLVFLNPNADPLGAGYTIIQSKIAVGSGGILGKGWLSGTQNQLNFLPERHTDFIFSVIGEEWGFLGALAVLILFLFLIRRLLNIGDTTNDIRGKLLIIAIVTLLWFHVFVNISMTIGLMPVVGIPLPLMSYGGSNLLTTLILIGLAISVQFRRKVF